MATVIRSSIHAILLRVQAQLMAVTAYPKERVIIDTESEDEQSSEANFQREQVLFVRRGAQTPEPGQIGMGRIWGPQRVTLHVAVWTRLALDEVPGFQIGLTDPNLGHEPVVLRVTDALLIHPPADDDGNWLVQEPLKFAGGVGPKRRKVESLFWAYSSQQFHAVYAPDVDQNRQ